MTRRSGKGRLETLNNIGNVISNLRKGCYDPERLSRVASLSERYKRNDARLHLHFTDSAGTNKTDFCAIFQYVKTSGSRTGLHAGPSEKTADTARREISGFVHGMQATGTG